MSKSTNMNKNDKITEIISGIEDRYVEEVSMERERDISRLGVEKKKRNTKIIKLSLTAAACVAVVFAARAALAGLFSASAPNVSKSFTEYTECKPIVAVSYPETPEFPSFKESYYNNDEKYNDYRLKYSNWRNEKSKRMVNAKSISISRDFYKNTASQFLSDSKGENRIYSPVNFYLALAMLSETTDGDTRAELLNLLGEESIESLRNTSQNLWLCNYRSDITTQTILANSIWLDKSLSYNEKTVDTLAKSYYAECFRENLSDESTAEKITDWINSKTGGFLSEAAKKIELPQDPMFFIYSTLYFKGRWDDEFSAQFNEERVFHSPAGDITAEFMYQTKYYGPYFWSEDYGAVMHSFSQGGKMWFILPDEDKSIEDILASGEYLDMISAYENSSTDAVWENSKSIRVNFYLPKFDVSSDINLNQGLRDLGVESVFEPGRADFSPITESEAFLGKIRHAARVAIDEEGCTAAAFTEEMMCGTGMPPEDEIDFVLDRPFIFVITSDVGHPLFIGTVYNP